MRNEFPYSWNDEIIPMKIDIEMSLPNNYYTDI